MNVILVPGFWLDASSWDAVVPSLRAAGHSVRALTMPGVGAPASDIDMADWVDAVVAEIDASDGAVVLVGHSGGGNVVWGAADARPDRMARVIFVDTAPPHPGGAISEFPVVDGVVPFPGWDFFDAPDVADLTAEARAQAVVASVPARVPTAPVTLTNDARFDIPVTLLMGSFDADELEAFIATWGPYADEYRAIRDRSVVRIGSGHWPQFSVPERLSALLVEAPA